MPNWVDITLRADGIDNMKIYDDDGNFDFNKIIPMPDYVKNTVSPLKEDSLLHYLVKDFGLENGLKKFRELGRVLREDYAGLKESELLEKTEFTKNESDWYEFSGAYELGKNYYLSKTNTGYFTWYDWAIWNWGTKWNACNCNLSYDHDFIGFSTAWDYPEPVLRKLSAMYPDVKFTAKCYYEDGDNIIAEFLNGNLVRETTFYGDELPY